MDYPKYNYCVEKETQRLQKLKGKNSALLKTINGLKIDQAAVLLAIFQYNGVPHVILTERSSNLRQHGGETALPGGKVDPEDENIIETALREAEEEIGLNRKHVRIIGETLPIPTKVAKVLVTTVVGFIEDIENVNLKINKMEVESVFAVPLAFFLHNTDPRFLTINGITLSYAWFKWNSKEYFKKLNLPKNNHTTAHELFDGEKTYKIWGLTALIINFYAALMFKKPMAFSASGDTMETFEELTKKIYKGYAKKSNL